MPGSDHLESAAVPRADPPPTSQARGRIEGLDALRGLAALVVFNSHAILCLGRRPPWLDRLLETPLNLFLLGGHAAVLFFFLLSGFVLFLPWTRDGAGRPYLPYLVKRVCRIYLPYLAGVAVVACAYAVFFRPRPLPGISPYFSWSPMSSADFWHLLGQHILFLGSFHRERWNSSTWTLAEEMRISLVFPFLAALLVRIRWRSMLLAAILSSAAVSLGVRILHHRFPLETLHYAAIFGLGAILAAHRGALVQAWRRLGNTAQTLLALVSLLVAAYSPQGTARWPEEASDWILALPLAVFLVSALAETWFTRALEHRHMQALGRISYSFYLLHVPCLYVAIELLWNHLPPAAVFALALLATLASASLFYRLVEVPAMQLGRRLARQLSH